MMSIPNMMMRHFLRSVIVKEKLLGHNFSSATLPLLDNEQMYGNQLFVSCDIHPDYRYINVALILLGASSFSWFRAHFHESSPYSKVLLFVAATFLHKRAFGDK